MEAKKPRSKHGPEYHVRESTIKMLRYKGWFVHITHGNEYSMGLPDLFCCHTSYGHRWVEVKNPGMKGSHFTDAQLVTFPKLCANGSNVFVLTGDSEEEYKKLFGRSNWYLYLDILK